MFVFAPCLDSVARGSIEIKHVDVFHDTVCPWCRIGKRHLDLALAAWDGPGVTVRWRPFLLHPPLPLDEGQDFRDSMAEWKGAQNRASMYEAVREAGAAVNPVFALEQIRLSTICVRLHVLVANDLAGARSGLLDARHRANLEHGPDIGDIDTLVEVAAATGPAGSATADASGTRGLARRSWRSAAMPDGSASAACRSLSSTIGGFCSVRKYCP